MKRHGYLTPFLAVCILLTQLGHCPPGLNAGADIWTTSGPVLGAVYDLAVGSEQGTAYAAIFDQKAVFRTTDYGASWQRLDSGISEGDAIHSVAVAGGTGDVLYALGFSTVYKSTDTGSHWVPVLELGGGPTATLGDRHDILVSQKDPSALVVLGESGIFRSIDAGATWTHVWSSAVGGLGVGRRLFVGPQPDVIYAVPALGQALRSADGGQNWAPTAMPQQALCMAFDPTNESIIYVGTTGLGVLKSVDSGESWQPEYTGNLPTGGLINDIIFHPSNPDIIFVAYGGDGDAGMYVSVDHGETWAAMNDGMGERSLWRAAVDRSNPVHLYAGTSVGVYSMGVVTLQPADYGISINGGAVYTNSESVQLDLSAPPNTSQMQITNDGSYSPDQWEPFSTTRSWTLQGYGNAVVTRVVYSRFRTLDGDVVGPYMDDIILDTVPPTGQVTIAAPGEGPSAAGIMARALVQAQPEAPAHAVLLPLVLGEARVGYTVVTLLLSATDDVSGVGAMRIGDDQAFSASQWEAVEASRAWWLPTATESQIHVQFRDRAGNESLVYTTEYAGDLSK